MAHFRFRSATQSHSHTHTRTHLEGKTCRKVYNENIFSLATTKESPENGKWQLVVVVEKSRKTVKSKNSLTHPNTHSLKNILLFVLPFLSLLKLHFSDTFHLFYLSIFPYWNFSWTGQWLSFRPHRPYRLIPAKWPHLLRLKRTWRPVNHSIVVLVPAHCRHFAILWLQMYFVAHLCVCPEVVTVHRIRRVPRFHTRTAGPTIFVPDIHGQGANIVCGLDVLMFLLLGQLLLAWLFNWPVFAESITFNAFTKRLAMKQQCLL